MCVLEDNLVVVVVVDIDQHTHTHTVSLNLTILTMLAVGQRPAGRAAGAARNERLEEASIDVLHNLPQYRANVAK